MRHFYLLAQEKCLKVVETTMREKQLISVRFVCHPYECRKILDEGFEKLQDTERPTWANGRDAKEMARQNVFDAKSASSCRTWKTKKRVTIEDGKAQWKSFLKTNPRAKCTSSKCYYRWAMMSSGDAPQKGVDVLEEEEQRQDQHECIWVSWSVNERLNIFWTENKMSNIAEHWNKSWDDWNLEKGWGSRRGSRRRTTQVDGAQTTTLKKRCPEAKSKWRRTDIECGVGSQWVSLSEIGLFIKRTKPKTWVKCTKKRWMNEWIHGTNQLRMKWKMHFVTSCHQGIH